MNAQQFNMSQLHKASNVNPQAYGSHPNEELSSDLLFSQITFNHPRHSQSKITLVSLFQNHTTTIPINVAAK
jgi:hypothetical protein